ncbi:MAG TPA: transketolase C-terminal domain-containing protein [Bdellovibrionota bacterium]|nr:transketolase C-terminal domain-containing protein [Bdellovibrionota bacterium]
MATIAQAIRMALHVGETRLGVKDIFGEDVGPPLGGVFTCTQGLKTAWNSPLDERGIVGTAFGLALAGQRPVAEIQFCDYIFNTIDLLKMAGNCRWSGNGDWEVPLVMMTPVGTGIHGAVYHSQSFDAMATHMPGWKVVFPSNPIDTYGLLISAIKDPNPVMFLYPKALIRVPGEERIPGEPEDARALSQMIDAPLGDRTKWTPKWPDLPDFEIPIGSAKLCREGTRLTVVSYGRTLPLCVKAADKLRDEAGISAEVIDLRTLFPYDWPAIKGSVQNTKRILVVNEDTEVTNFGEHLVRKVVDECFYDLEAPPKLLAGANTPGVGLAWPLEEASVPQESTIEQAMREVASAQP